MLFGTPSLLSFQFFVIVFYTCIYRAEVMHELMFGMSEQSEPIPCIHVDSISRDGPDCPYM